MIISCLCLIPILNGSEKVELNEIGLSCNISYVHEFLVLSIHGATRTTTNPTNLFTIAIATHHHYSFNSDRMTKRICIKLIKTTVIKSVDTDKSH